MSQKTDKELDKESTNILNEMKNAVKKGIILKSKFNRVIKEAKKKGFKIPNTL